MPVLASGPIVHRVGPDSKKSVTSVAVDVSGWFVVFGSFTDWRFLGKTPEELDQLISRLPDPIEEPAATAPPSRGWALERRLPAESLNAIVRAYEGGASSRQLAATHGIAVSTVQSLLKRRGVVLRGGSERVKLTIAQEAEIARRYAEGAGSHTIASEFGVGSARVLQIARDAGLPIHGTWPDEDALARASALYGDGLTIEQVAKELRFSTSTMRRAMKEAGIALRPKGRRPSSPSL